MSIQRYDILHPKMRDKGRFVLYADHIADKDAELHNILSPLADIRAALGVGEKPMLSELAGIVRTRMGVIKILEREAKENAAEVERLTAERDAAVRERDAAVKALREIVSLTDPEQGSEDDDVELMLSLCGQMAMRGLSSPPADASKMGGERDLAPYISEPWGGPEGEE